MNATHSPTCSGCPICNAELARVLTMSSAEHARWLASRSAPHRVTPPPSLVNAIRGAGQHRISGLAPAEPRTQLAAGTVAPPPSLVAAIQERNLR